MKPRIHRHRLTGFVALCALLALQGCAGVQNPAERRAQQHLQSGRQYLTEGLMDSALAAFGLALEENPKLVEAHMGMGEIYRQRGQYDLAENAYSKAAQLEPDNFDAHYYSGLMQQLLGMVRNAVNSYLRALAIDPNSFDANQSLASAYLQLARPADALPYALRATELKADSQPAWANLAATYSLLNRHDEAVEAYRQALELGEAAEPLLLGLAEAHVRLTHYERAINVLQSLVRMKPSSTAYERMGYAQFKLRLFDQALASYRTAMSIDSRDPAVLNGLGVCLMTLYIQSGRTDPAQRTEALDAWRRSIQIRPNQPRIVDLMIRYQRL